MMHRTLLVPCTLALLLLLLLLSLPNHFLQQGMQLRR
jgi:hypothetical protein